MRPWALLVTCEHGGHRVPSAWRDRFAGHEALLRSHRGWDPGALALARHVASALNAPLIAATTTRLLVDLNRSPHNPRVFSSLARPETHVGRLSLLAEHHAPHWQRVRSALTTMLAAHRRVIHVGMHSFTPSLDGCVRKIDLALLYDPRRRGEVTFCDAWLAALREQDAQLRLRRNAPYRGVADGLVTQLRRELPAQRYLGIELEMNQAIVTGPGARWRALRRTITTSLAETLRG